MRLGRIPWINCYPVYGAIDRGLVRVPAELVTGTASELNDLLAAGELQVSVVSAVEYARNAAAYHLLPDLAITCDGPVHSVALFSRRPVEDLDGCTVLRTASSRTSVLLLDLIARHRWGVRPRYATARAEAADLAGSRACRTKRCSSSATRRCCSRRRSATPCAWIWAPSGRRGPGCPSCSRCGPRAGTPGSTPCRRVHQRLLESRAWGLAHLDELARGGGARAPASRETVCRSYLGDLDYALSYRHLAGLTDFFRRLAQEGLVPDGSLSFITAA